jgi:cell fate (sporulation/competence/biofilm development) regulator YlbF (YheA/YmcA/DUF963 family)
VSVYHLHIPRTAGIYLSNNVLPHLISGGVEHFSSNRSIIDPEKIKASRYVAGHFGLMPLDFMDQPEVFTVVRNPVDRFISYFNYTTGLIRTKSEAHQKLDSWLYGSQQQIQSNLQAKFLTGYMDYEKFNNGVNEFQNAVNNAWFIKNYSLDFNDVKANIDTFNCYTLDNHEAFKRDLNKVFEKDFGFTTFKYSDKANRSNNLGIEMTKSQLKRIEEINALDMEVYEYVQKNQKR